MEWIEFLHRFVRTPRQIGSVSPSSIHLARTMVRDVPWNRCKVIAELGAGTGAITRMIESSRRPGSRFHVFEMDPAFRKSLAGEFADVLLHSDARDLLNALRNTGDTYANVIFSGLPFTLMHEEHRSALLDAITQALAPEGSLVAFQYTPLFLPAFRQYFRRVQVRFVPLNLPPAFVYRCVDPIRPTGTGAGRTGEVTQ